VRPRSETLWGLVVGMLIGASVNASTPPFTLPDENRVPPWSLQLERKAQPWCPGDCVLLVPFVASYRNGTERLVFVGVRHAFKRSDPSMRAVAAGFAKFRPGVVIVEGFPTAMGENPPPLVAEAHRYGSAEADEFARGEAMYAASLALMRGIPFLGGEPTREEEIRVLKSKGFTDADIAFSALLGLLSQALRSRDIPDTSLGSLTQVYPQLAQALKLPLDHGGWNLDAPSLDEFRQRYREMYGADIVGDARFPRGIDMPEDTTRRGRQFKVDMMTRDRHLLGLIEQQLDYRHAVLVVYGGSHWSTLSAALEERLGKPEVTPFLK
jgi:hypothetical protein